ncbi:hypothetical protein KUV50_07575 [Membranicola marinus]|uniref:Uncharacterized protein n=1 Tax=Membranihabitans marinus TaxID=1227546 RepID=A0A953HNS3_9BACT|nr:hypothetical protein [Membranihabitans marinus]MBY5957983.1 hypothetical protein [Membranihabitans marinus]
MFIGDRRRCGRGGWRRFSEMIRNGHENPTSLYSGLKSQKGRVDEGRGASSNNKDTYTLTWCRCGGACQYGTMQ